MSNPEQPGTPLEPDSQPRTNLLQKVLAWLKAGYPQGIPQSDYVALLAVLHRRLTDYEVQIVVEDLIHDHRATAEIARTDIAREDIEAAIARVAKEQPGEDDIARVASRLAAGGWPLATPTSD
ncbi:DUF3349 domain-containing protein [Nocardia sp. IFM 10818]